jgi:endonuclease/exonuclease/phosphatase family metal-dependent hydrolase
MSQQPPSPDPATQAAGSRRRRIRWLVGALILFVLVATIHHGSISRPAGPATGTAFATPAPTTAATTSTLRLATFNIHSARGSDGRIDLDRVVRQLNGFALIGLNEVRGTAPWRDEDQAALLGRKLQFPWLFAPTETQWWHDSFGNAALCSLPVRQWQRIPIPGTSGRGCRNLLLLSVEFNGRPLHVLITHIDRLADRQEQLRTASERFLSLAEPAILMGDMNTPGTDPQLQTLRTTSGVVDAITQSAPQRSADNIDWIFLRGLKLRAAGLIDSDASDHPMAWAEVQSANPPAP